MSPTIRIVPFESAHQPYFQALNEAWITQLFSLEATDTIILTNPQATILARGGQIFMLLRDGKVVGTCALLKTDHTVYELTKLALDPAVRGLGLGELLVKRVIWEARRIGAKRIELYTQKVLPAAVSLYRKLGFTEQALMTYKYSRADTFMYLDINEPD